MFKKSTLRFALCLWMFSLVISGCSGAKTDAQIQPSEPFILTSLVSATGEVIPAQYASLSFPSAGVLNELLVTENQEIGEGDVLLRLSGSEKQKAGVTSAELELVSARQAMQDLVENAEQQRAQAMLRLAEARKVYEKAAERRAGKDYRIGTNESIEIGWADLVVANDEVQKAEDGFAYFADRPFEDVERAKMLSMVNSLKKERDKVQANLNYLLSLPDDIEVAKADAELEVARVEVELAMKEYSRWKDGPDLDEVEIAQSRLVNAEQQLQAAANSLSDLELVAPFAGTVINIYVRQNEWVTPGAPVVVIADLQDLRIETTDLSEIDVARIAIGSPATVTFDAFPDLSVRAVVMQIDSRAAEGSGVNFKTTLKLIETPPGLRWGMTAFVDIDTGE